MACNTSVTIADISNFHTPRIIFIFYYLSFEIKIKVEELKQIYLKSNPITQVPGKEGNY